MSAQQELNRLRTLVQQNGALTSAITNDLPLLAKQGENPDATMSEVYDLVKPLSENLAPIVGLSIELEGGKKNIANSLNNRGVYASASESLTSLAEKIYEVKNPVAFTVPAETSNKVADDFFNTMMKSQGYDQIYESVYETYCGEGGSYVGCLMTDLYISTNTSIQLIGADAYYIYEEDIFYKTGEGGKLIQFLNGSEVQLATDKHVWDTDIKNPCRIVFYLYLPNSTADGKRENVHASNIDYCRNSTIPYIKYSSNSGRFMYFHLSNPELCVLSYGTGNNTRTVFFCSNVETCSATMALTGNRDYMNYVSLENLKSVSAGNVVNSTKIRNIEFPNLEEIKGGVLLHEEKPALESLTLPKLKSVVGGSIFLRRAEGLSVNTNNIMRINLPQAEELIMNGNSNGHTGAVICIAAGELELTIKSGCIIRSLITGSGTASAYVLPDVVKINCDELYTNISNVGTSTISSADIRANSVYFNGLKKCILFFGSTGGYVSTTKYMYVNCIGGRTDEIKMLHSSSTSASSTLTDIEISDGARQPLTFNLFRGLTAENIVSHIFERLADNRFEDDGVTPAPAITITIGSVNLAKLTDAQKAIATDKNYILA